ncbi:hypothetical protein BUALT_Bualt05G0084000 [Buddleja alternifolia]|uniref:Transposase n=1 Tax=Buddleja alternifolia TaxID=168488 RepID=A0AAV6XJ48_9LAMI|nr:hypothetical protein BUALT_Bualt05G0084000 [Buddleja alternifolia]
MENLHEIISISDTTCLEQLRMDRNCFGRLCMLLRDVGGLKPTRNVQINEQVAIFLHILGHHTKNRIVKQSYKRSGYTISKHFNSVLNSLLKLYPILLANPDPISEDSTNETWKWFKGCLGALDGTYIPVQVSATDKARYRNRKGDIAVNVLAVCDLNMRFVYVLTGWEGSAADSRVLRDAITRENGLRIPNDITIFSYMHCGYTNGNGFLAPYRGIRCHHHEWNNCNVAPQNYIEFFNKTHSKARNCIERSFGLLKMRFAVLRSNTFYPIKVQNRIIMGCCLVHNFIRMEMAVDPLEALVDEIDDPSDDPDIAYIEQVAPSQQWNNWRDGLARSMYQQWTGGAMASSSSRGQSAPSREGPVKGHRSWTKREEAILASALKELVARGWKCDNGFRTGYQGHLEQAMHQAFPGTDIRAEPHINSRLTVWKKNYGSINTMLSRSGFAWNDTSKTVDVSSDQVWDNFVKTDSNARTMRHKSWPLYKDWCEIFGKDRATGEDAEGFADIAAGLRANGNGKQQVGTMDEVPIFHHTEEDGAESIDVSHINSSVGAGKSDKSRKRKSSDDCLEGFMDIMKTFCTQTDSRLGAIASRIGFEHDASKCRKTVYESLGRITKLTVDDKLFVSKRLIEDTKNMDLFFSLSDEDALSMVSMIVEGRY